MTPEKFSRAARRATGTTLSRTEVQQMAEHLRSLETTSQVYGGLIGRPCKVRLIDGREWTNATLRAVNRDDFIFNDLILPRHSVQSILRTTP